MQCLIRLLQNAKNAMVLLQRHKIFQSNIYSYWICDPGMIKSLDSYQLTWWMSIVFFTGINSSNFHLLEPKRAVSMETWRKLIHDISCAIKKSSYLSKSSFCCDIGNLSLEILEDVVDKTCRLFYLSFGQN